MAQLEVARGERNQSSYGETTSAAWTTIGSPSVAAASLVTGKKYLIIARAEVKGKEANPGALLGMRLLHGTTEFTESAMEFLPDVSSADHAIYWYVTVWTAVAGEGLTMQVHADGAHTVQYNFATLTAIRLSDALVEGTDWVFNENVVAAALDTTPTARATITFTPGTGGQTWLVLTDAMLQVDLSGSDFCGADLSLDGGAALVAQRGGKLAGERRPTPPPFWIGTLTAAAHTFTLRSLRSAGSGGTHRRSALFALRLPAFDVASTAQDDTQKSPGTFNVAWAAQGLTLSHTQAIEAGLVLVIGYCAHVPNLDGTGARRWQNARVQLDNVDTLSEDGTTNTYSLTSTFARWFTPINVDGNVLPYMLAAIETPAAGPHSLDLDFGGQNASTRGSKFFRLAAISLEITPPPPTPGSGGAVGSLERNDQIMYQSDYRAERRRVRVRLVDATDNVTPEAGEAGGQGSISVNGGAYTTTGVGVLVAEDAANGLYYAELTKAALNVPPGSSIRFRYKSAATALFSVTVPVEERAWIDDGLAAGGGANYLDLEAAGTTRSLPARVPAGSIVVATDGTGAEQSQVALSYAAPRVTVEQNWTTAPDGTTRYKILPGLPPVVPDVNVAQVNKSATAAQRLQGGADAALTGTVQAGTNTTTQVTTDLPTVVGGVATPPNHYKGRSLYLTSGPGQGDYAAITASVVSGGLTVLTVDTLAQVPVVGNTFLVT